MRIRVLMLLDPGKCRESEQKYAKHCKANFHERAAYIKNEPEMGVKETSDTIHLILNKAFNFRSGTTEEHVLQGGFGRSSRSVAF